MRIQIAEALIAYLLLRALALGLRRMRALAEPEDHSPGPQSGKA
jgi:hypothetical protein